MSGLKSAIITPLLKGLNHSIDSDLCKNYRPISNLPFLSKLVERCVAARLEKHIFDNKLDSPCQFGYKENHSTELLLLNTMDSIAAAFDKNCATLLLLLDLSAAFDTVDQDILLEILKSRLGVNGIALKWFTSYLKGRSQQVLISGALSEPTMLNFGVPQGSVLGSILREFKIQGQIGEPHQEDKISFISLMMQVRDGKAKHYAEKEIVSAILHSLTPALSPRTLLKTIADLSLTQRLQISRNHFKEKSATELYQELSNMTQGAGEDGNHF
eukprot:gene4014-4560_t